MNNPLAARLVPCRTVTHKQLAVFCSEAYDRPDKQVWSVSETDALVKEYDDCVVIAFRGTEFSKSIFRFSWRQFSWSGFRKALSNTRDVIRDLRFFPVYLPGPMITAHAGFAKSANSWVGQFGSRIVAMGKPVYVTGHSLGAAIAPLVAALLHVRHVSIKECVAIGEPKGFYRGSAERYQQLAISTTSYRGKGDWIRRAGFGTTCVEPTVLPIRSHDIKQYIVPSKPGRWCPKCSKSHASGEECPHRKSWSSGKATGKGRGGRIWQRKRKQIFERDDYLCQDHKRQGKLVPVELHGRNAGICDHITAIEFGGTDDEGNLQTLCQPCHKEKTQKESMEARGRGV